MFGQNKYFWCSLTFVIVISDSKVVGLKQILNRDVFNKEFTMVNK